MSLLFKTAQAAFKSDHPKVPCVQTHPLEGVGFENVRYVPRAVLGHAADKAKVFFPDSDQPRPIRTLTRSSPLVTSPAAGPKFLTSGPKLTGTHTVVTRNKTRSRKPNLGSSYPCFRGGFPLRPMGHPLDAPRGVGGWPRCARGKITRRTRSRKNQVDPSHRLASRRVQGWFLLFSTPNFTPLYRVTEEG